MVHIIWVHRFLELSTNSPDSSLCLIYFDLIHTRKQSFSPGNTQHKDDWIQGGFRSQHLLSRIYSFSLSLCVPLSLSLSLLSPPQSLRSECIISSDSPDLPPLSSFCMAFFFREISNHVKIEKVSFRICFILNEINCDEL